LTHIVLAAVTVGLVLFTLYFALTEQFQKHKRIARWTYPIWLYVSVTGVIVYFMISPYYT
jgi:putative membrane protein